MASDRSALAAMRRAAQEKARAHSWDRIATDTVALYERVLAVAPRAGPGHSRRMAAGGSERGWRRRPLAGVLGLRPPVVEHTPDEGELLRRTAGGATRAVEIGVAEGGSACDLRT